MASIISAGTTSGTALNMAGDTSGVLQLATNGSTTALTIDTSQNVGIGTASPTAKLQANVTSAGSNTTPLVVSNASATTSTECSLGFSPFSDTSIITGSIGLLNQGSGAYSLKFSNWNGSANTERMRIDSSGNVLVGTTSTSNSVVGLRFNNTVSSGYMQILSTKTLSGELNFLMNFYNGTYVGGINYTNTATSFPTSSDVRLKKDIVDAPSATQKIDNIRIVSHGWKHDDEVVDFGIIAQDLYDVAPRAVTKGDDGEEVEKTWSVDYSKLVPMLIKAHQEQQTIINDLKARITALEGAA